MAALLVIVGNRRAVHAVGLLGTMIVAVGAAVALAVLEFRSGGAIAHGISSWPFGIAIPFVADMFTALMLVVTGLLTIVCSWFAIASDERPTCTSRRSCWCAHRRWNCALLTADLFNLFVFIEVMLLPSYGLFVLAARHKGTLQQVAGARLYVTLNLLTSTVFLIGVGFIYGTAGTVNMAELAGLASTDPHGCNLRRGVSVCAWDQGLGGTGPRLARRGLLLRPHPPSRLCSPGCTPRSPFTASTACTPCSSTAIPVGSGSA